AHVDGRLTVVGGRRRQQEAGPAQLHPPPAVAGALHRGPPRHDRAPAPPGGPGLPATAHRQPQLDPFGLLTTGASRPPGPRQQGSVPRSTQFSHSSSKVAWVMEKRSATATLAACATAWASASDGRPDRTRWAEMARTSGERLQAWTSWTSSPDPTPTMALPR